MNVLIIGGSSDIGISLAKYLKELSYNVILTYNHNEVNVPNIEAIKLDIKNENEISSVFKNVIYKYKKIDCLINMAAISKDNNFLDKTKKEFMEVLEVNLVGNFLTCQTYSKYISDGVIINIGSTDGIDTYSPYSIDYSASKAGIINVTKSIAMCTDNKVYCLCPNWIDSDSTKSMNYEYLASELKRINQSRLITLKEFNESIYNILKSNDKSGTIYRLDIKGDNLWIEKI